MNITDINSAKPSEEETNNVINENLKSSLPPQSYSWWNVSWSFRIPVSISSDNDQENAPVELLVNFTDYLNDLSVDNPWLDKYSIRVIEYESSSEFWEIDCEFEPYERIYDNETNAVGDVVWILNGTTTQGNTRDFFIYFNNGSISEVPTDYYTNLRVWHEGFETYRPGDINGGISSQDTYPTSGDWEVSNTTSARGSSSLHIWGNCWKDEELDGFDFSEYPSVKVSAKMRFDDENIDREISGIGFHDIRTAIPDPADSYGIRGSQPWGSAESYKYRNQYYAASTFFWYTLGYIAHDDYVFYIADDDSYTDRDLYWDDISIWDVSIQDINTVPDHLLDIDIGDIEAASFRLDVTCLDENGDLVPNAKVYLSNITQVEHFDETDEEGIANFLDLEQGGKYNITVNFTQDGLDDPITETVYFDENYEITKLDNTLTAFLNLTSFYFNISDNDHDPVQYGYVLLKEGSTNVGKDDLNSLGNATIRWTNDTINYDYEVYYDFNARPGTATYIDSELNIIPTTSIPTIYINAQANISKVYFNVTELDSKDPFPYAKLRIYNQSGYNFPDLTENVANITIGTDGRATFIYFADNYGDWGNYTLDVYFAGQRRSIKVNDGPLKTPHNFTLSRVSYTNISVELNVNQYNTTIGISSYTNEVVWNGNITLKFNFTRNEPSLFDVLENPDVMNFQILDEEGGDFSEQVNIKEYQYSKGLFNYTFNSSHYGLIGGTRYKVSLTGTFGTYVPAEIELLITINSVSTSVSVHDYGNPTPASEFTQFYGELINISVRYYESDTLKPLEGASVSYKWLNLGYTTINPDPIYDGYYTFTLNTSDAGETGTETIRIQLGLQNYSSISDFFVNLEIRPIRTLISGEESIIDTANIRVGQPLPLYFSYNTSNGTPIEGARTTYIWRKGSGSFSSAVLVNTSIPGRYSLDFNTENRPIGTYSLIATFEKTNYETRTASYIINILAREIEADLDATNIDDDQINIVKGNKVTIEVELTDPIDGN
ncbi:MAG: hypothetical protein GF383_07505, partial [Candidatus Lokiarchaeota archaeon]|nr:hypothetical protein [Candidatus Lokiarchaeota archaeon]